MRSTMLALLLLCSTAHAQVYRCGNTYSSTPCPGAKTVDVRPPASVQESNASPTETIFLCKSYAGQRFWTKQNCYQRGGATLDREVSVPRGLSWQDQVAIASKTRQDAESLQQVPAAPARASRNSKGFDCQSIADALRANQSSARAGGSSAWMDHLNRERAELHARRTALRC